MQSNWSYFNIEKFKWTPKIIGISLAVVGVLVSAVQGGLVRFVNPKLGNEKSVYVGLLLYTFGLVLFGLATQSWMMFVFLIPYCLGGISGPGLQAIISGQVPPNEQGELQGSLTSVISITSIVGPLVMSNLFAYFTGPSAPIYFPGAPFMLAAFLMLLSCFFAYRALRTK